MHGVLVALEAIAARIEIEGAPRARAAMLRIVNGLLSMTERDRE